MSEAAARLRLLLLAATGLLATALLAPPQAPGAESDSKKADVRIDWTEYHVPHIPADSWKGLARGYGYAFASPARRCTGCR